MFGIRRRLTGRIRRFNRWWLDALAPTPEGAPAPPGEVVRAAAGAVPAPTARAAVTVTSEETPNPDARKFTASVRVVSAGSVSFSNRRAAGDHPLGSRIFEIEGVKSIFATGDFLTVTRQAGADWKPLSVAIEERLRATLGESGG